MPNNSSGVAVAAAAQHALPHPDGRRWRWAGWIGVVAIAGAAGFGGYRSLTSGAAPEIRYETAAIDRGSIAAKVAASGQVSALVTVLVGSQVSGRIDSIKVDFNSPVHKGQIIATIEPSLFQAAVAQARANRAVAAANVDNANARLVEGERQLARAKLLLGEGILSRADYDVAEANDGAARAQLGAAKAAVAQSKAALDQAELNLHNATILSPIDGVVISRNIDVGQTVAATLQSPTLFTIAQDLTRMQVDTNVAEADVGKIRAGMQVTFSVDAYPGRKFAGAVRQVRDAAQTIQNVVTYDAVIDVDNPDRALKPGMTASVSFPYAERAAALRIPNAALRFRPDAATLALMSGPADKREQLGDGQRSIWVVRAGRAVPVLVRIGVSDGTASEVLDGDVREGDATVIEAIALANGAKRGM